MNHWNSLNDKNTNSAVKHLLTADNEGSENERVGIIVKKQALDRSNESYDKKSHLGCDAGTVINLENFENEKSDKGDDESDNENEKLEGKNAGRAVLFEEALEVAGSGYFQRKMVIVGGLSLMCSFVAVTGIAFVLPAAQCDLKMDSLDKGNLISSGFLGLILSCHMWGFLSDRLGRHYVIVRSLLFDGLLYIITSLTPYYSVILVLRFFNGIVSCGSVVSLYAYVGEFHTDKRRTGALMIMSVIGSLSYIILPVIAWSILSSKWEFVLFPGLLFKPWRLYYAVLGLPSLSCFLLLFMLPESPKFLLAKGDKTRAISILQRIYKENQKKDSCEQYNIKDIRISDAEKLVKIDDDANKLVAFFRLMWTQTIPLFKRPYLLSMFLICATQFLLFMIFGGVYLWLPETMNRLAIFKAENENAMASYCEIVQYDSKYSVLNNTSCHFGNCTTENTITQNADDEICSEEVDSSVYFNLESLGICQSIFGLICTVLLNFFNKKLVIVFCISVSLISTLCLIFVKMLVVIPVAANLAVMFCGVSIASLNSIMVDLFPTNFRAMAACLVLMFGRFGTVSANTLAGSLIDNHCYALLWILVASAFACIIMVLFIPKRAPYIDQQRF